MSTMSGCGMVYFAWKKCTAYFVALGEIIALAKMTTGFVKD